jgi:HD-GYP domain-containing protein (c-di-GMP phosphodiesterase class II)
MALKEIKVRIPDLEPGMYVCQLDRPWIETPYLLQGFLIKSQEDIDELLKYCEYVLVDVELSQIVEKKAVQFPNKANLSEENEEAQKRTLIKIKPNIYKDTAGLEAELKTATDSHALLTRVTEDIMENISNNKNLDLPSIKKAINPMVDSIIRNPDAFAWLTRLKSKDNYTYSHSVNASVWAVAFGRHLGLPRPDLQSLAIGALLFDTGKIKLPGKLISNPSRYSQYEFKLIKQHVEHSVDIVRSIDGINDEVINMVKTHHERHNGGGYPGGLSGDMIPIFGKIAGIVDCYDAITSERPFVSAISPHEAVKKLYEWRDIDFQLELVEQFIQVVGIYPVGTIVELSDGRVGVIVAHHRVWRLRPKIMLLLDHNKVAYGNFSTINLITELTGIDGNPLNITKSVEPSLYGIDTEQLYL